MCAYMVMEKVLGAARAYLDGKTVRDLTVGVSLIACELDSGDVGISYVLRDQLPNGCSVFPYAQEVINRPAWEIAEWSVSGGDDLQRGIASAVLVAASRGQDMPDEDKHGAPFGLVVTKKDTVGMVGLIAPVAERLKNMAGRLIVFDQGLSMHGGNDMISDENLKPALLPECDAVILSGTTTTNGTIDSLLEMCGGARDVVLVGPSTPMFPSGWIGTRVTRLAGSWWTNEHKDEIFRLVSLACGVSHLQKFMIKKLAVV